MNAVAKFFASVFHRIDLNALREIVADLKRARCREIVAAYDKRTNRRIGLVRMYDALAKLEDAGQIAVEDEKQVIGGQTCTARYFIPAPTT